MSDTPHLIRSRDNPTFKALAELARSPRARRRTGQTLLDGEHLLQAALDAGHVPDLLILAQGCVPALRRKWVRTLAGTPVLELTRGLFAALTPLETPSGLLARIPVPAGRTDRAGDLPEGLLLLEDIQDPGNLGAILRVAAAAGMARVCLSQGCAEAWSPKSLRGGQGAQFQLALREGVDLVAEARAFAAPVHAGLPGDGTSLFQLDLRGRVGFAFGNEGAGLSAELQAVCTPFSIPMRARVESLNVATAAAVCLFERLRQIS
ncbi:MAG TPA: RNA methyltransferase [Thiobacillaceae bacterium]|nr:RNA methyltransferase [Thiobacillaceae bacterium]HNU64991.1 RNA methyltransferase [Thiobacillaceae bacterium]